MGKGRGRGGDEFDDCCEAMCEEGGVLGVSCIVMTVVAVILIAVSFGNIDVQEVGLFYNGISVTINRAELIPNGLHFTGVGNSFVLFPKLTQTVILADRSVPGAVGSNLTGRTQDGLVVDMQISVGRCVCLCVCVGGGYGGGKSAACSLASALFCDVIQCDTV